MKVSILGCGAVGSFVARWVSGEEGFELACVFDTDRGKSERLSQELGTIAAVDVDEFLELEADIVVEAASQRAVLDYAESILKSGKDLIALSAGAFADERFYDRVKNLAAELGRKVFIPSGALAGIDAVKAVAEYTDTLTLVTRKLDFGVKERGKVFDGNAREAAKLFPRNLNVAATLGVAAGFDRVRVIAVSEDIDENVHEITAVGRFGGLHITVKNRRMDDNPKTSYLAALSVVRVLKDINSSVVVV